MVTDSNNCVDSSFVTIPAITAVTAAVSTTPVQCNLPNSGSQQRPVQAAQGLIPIYGQMLQQLHPFQDWPGVLILSPLRMPMVVQLLRPSL